MEGSWQGEGASESSLWDFLGDEEQMLCETADRPVVEGFSCSWADHQTVENLALFPYSLSEDGAPVEPQGLPFASTATEGLEHLFGSSSFLASPPGTPAIFAFKDAFATLSPCAPACQKLGAACLPRTSPTGSAKEFQQQPFPSPEVAVDIHLADEGSDSVTCTITGDLKASKAWSSKARGDKGSSGASDAVRLVQLNFLDRKASESVSEMSEHEGDSSAPGCAAEVDLQCKGEQLSLDYDEDSSGDANLTWLHTTADGCMGFIPVSNALTPADSSISGEPARRRGIDWGTEESADETEDLSCTRSEAKATSVRHLTSGTRDDDGESLERSSLESVLSEGTTTSGLEGRRRSKPGSKLVEALSVIDISLTGTEAPAGNKRRPGRPCKPTVAASEARAAAATKRKRATTSKPAAPTTTGQACTQCFTHITPVWRAGPEGPKTLCNACGVRYMKVAKRK